MPFSAALTGMALLTAGCGGAEPLDTGFAFSVTAVSPAADEPVTQATVPALTFSASADPTTCTTSTLRLDALTRDLTVDTGSGAGDTGGASGPDHTVDFSVPVQLSWSGEDQVQLVHASLLPRGWRYAVTVTGGEAGCLSADAQPMLGYYFTFDVP